MTYLRTEQNTIISHDSGLLGRRSFAPDTTGLVNKYGVCAKGRGAVSNSSGRYERAQVVKTGDDYHHSEMSPNMADNKTVITEEKANSIISKNQSPDIPFSQSINAYRGCEHGCVYCFARPSHSYMGLSAGLDFERQLFVKRDAAVLLEEALSSKNYKMEPIALGTNTDPYQPIEKNYKITREILEVMNKYNHPCSIVTKNKMVVRDIDILSEMAEKGLVKVYLSVTTLNARLSRLMEPRASAPAKRLDAIKLLSDASIPVGAMFAPVIPAINDIEMEQILKAVKHAGASEAAYVLLRLPLEVADIFSEWLEAYFPDRKDRVLSRLSAMRGGRVNDPRFRHRMKGTGFEADLLRRRFQVHTRRVGLNMVQQAHEPQASNSSHGVGHKVRFNVPVSAMTKEDRASGQLNLFS